MRLSDVSGEQANADPVGHSETVIENSVKLRGVNPAMFSCSL